MNPQGGHEVLSISCLIEPSEYFIQYGIRSFEHGINECLEAQNRAGIKETSSVATYIKRLANTSNKKEMETLDMYRKIYFNGFY